MAAVTACILTALMDLTRVRKNCVEPVTTAAPQHLCQSEMERDVTYLPQIFVIGASVPKLRALHR